MTEEKDFKRRDFLKLAGLTGIALPAIKVVGNVTGCEYCASQEAYGGFVVRRSTKENPPYQVDESVYQRFSLKNLVASQIMWNKEVRAEMIKRIMAAAPAELMKMPKNPSAKGMARHNMKARLAHMHIKKKTPGKTRLDYAFMGGAWTVATTFGTRNEGGLGEMVGLGGEGTGEGLYSWSSLGGTAESQLDLHSEDLGRWDPSDYSPQEITDIVKVVARFYGASLVGIAETDERWFYSHGYTGPDKKPPPIVFDDVDAPIERDDYSKVIPRSMKYAVVLAFETDYDGVQANLTGPSEAAYALGYSKMAFTAASLAEFFRGLGYHAIPSGNATALSTPTAIDAGLGELGRHGIMITPKYGPRVRLSKVFTDFPLVPDKPITFGVTEFCEVCGKCAEQCPGSAISHGSRTWKGDDTSSNPGVYKWYINAGKCLGVWMAESVSCGQCINVCPFNKPTSWLHEMIRGLIGARSGVIDKVLLDIDDASGYGQTGDPREFWNKKKAALHSRD
jgi:reductive dehalogenase